MVCQGVYVLAAYRIQVLGAVRLFFQRIVFCAYAIRYGTWRKNDVAYTVVLDAEDDVSRLRSFYQHYGLCVEITPMYPVAANGEERPIVLVPEPEVPQHRVGGTAVCMVSVIHNANGRCAIRQQWLPIALRYRLREQVAQACVDVIRQVLVYLVVCALSHNDVVLVGCHYVPLFMFVVQN